MNSLLLLRGLPGSGKTTLATQLTRLTGCPVLSVDSYFTNPVTGKYTFDFSKNHLAYKQCEDQTKVAMQQGLPLVVVDNTFTHGWEMEPYFKLAAEYGYHLFVTTVENYHGHTNTHQVSESQMKKMADNYHIKLM